MEALIKEHSLSPPAKEVAKILTNIVNTLKSAKAVETKPLDDQQWLQETGITLPVFSKPRPARGHFGFNPPSKILLAGSFTAKTMMSFSDRNSFIDVVVEIPDRSFSKRDCINQIYHHKRSLYLAYIGHLIQQHCSKDIRSIRFGYDFNRLRPVLLLEPQSTTIRCRFRILLSAFNFCKLSRFLPHVNNVRPNWFLGEETKENDDSNLDPTPHFNQLILHDLTLISNSKKLKTFAEKREQYRQCMILLKIWCYRHSLSDALQFPLLMYFVYLLEKNIINPNMSTMQLFRKTLYSFAESNWTQDPIYFGSEQPTHIDEFKEHFDVNFLHENGHFNICYRLKSDVYRGAKDDARITVENFDSDSEFSLLNVLRPIHFFEKFDTVITIKFPVSNNFMEKIPQSKGSMLNLCGDFAPFYVDFLMELIDRGLSSRIISMQRDEISLRSIEWDTCSSPFDTNRLLHKLRIGVILSPENHLLNVIRGPSADLPEAAAFREFWGDLSELRRFQEGIICEAVYFPAKTFATKREIFGIAVRTILKKHAFIESSAVTISGSELDHLLYRQRDEKETYGTGEESALPMMTVFENLSKKLRDIKDMTLQLTTLQGISPVFRGAEIFPPLPQCQSRMCLLPFEEGCWKFGLKRVKLFERIVPIDVITSTEISNKWPSDLEALNHFRCLLYLELKETLHEKYQICSRLTSQTLDIYCEGYVFRLYIACDKELIKIQPFTSSLPMPQLMNGTAKGHQNILANEIRDTELVDVESRRKLDQVSILDEKIHRLPLITSALNVINLTFPAYSSTVRLVKRWSYCQLLLDHIGEINIELLVAKLFLNPFPYTAPQSPNVGFLRFLDFVSNTNFIENPVIVNFNGSLSYEQLKSMDRNFRLNRKKHPPLVIWTSFDTEKSMWSRTRPTLPFLKRYQAIAKASFNIFIQTTESGVKFNVIKLFLPVETNYDMRIVLKKNQINYRYRVDVAPTFNNRGKEMDETAASKTYVPIVDYDPVLVFVRKLNQIFGEYFHFFYDKFGSESIGFIWKANAFQPIEIDLHRMSNMKATGKVSRDGKPMMVLNFDTVIEDIKILGQSVIESFEINRNKFK